MTEATREFGVYSTGHASPLEMPAPNRVTRGASEVDAALRRLGDKRPGVCSPWSEAKAAIPAIRGDAALVEPGLGRRRQPGLHLPLAGAAFVLTRGTDRTILSRGVPDRRAQAIRDTVRLPIKSKDG